MVFKIEKREDGFNRIVYKNRGIEIYSYFDSVEYLDDGSCNVDLYFKKGGRRVVALSVRKYLFDKLKKEYSNMKKFGHGR